MTGLVRDIFHSSNLTYDLLLLFVFNGVFVCQVLDETSHEVTDEGVQSTVDVKVTSDITVFCNATNDFGTDALTFNIKASEFLLLLALPVRAVCVSCACTSLSVVPLATPLFPSVPALVVCVTPPFIFKLRLKASSSATCCDACDSGHFKCCVVDVVVVPDETLWSCAAVKCAPLLPQCVTGSVLPFCASNCFQLHTPQQPPQQQPPPPLLLLVLVLVLVLVPLLLPLPFPLPQVRPQSVCTIYQAPGLSEMVMF